MDTKESACTNRPLATQSTVQSVRWDGATNTYRKIKQPEKRSYAPIGWITRHTMSRLMTSARRSNKRQQLYNTHFIKGYQSNKSTHTLYTLEEHAPLPWMVSQKCMYKNGPTERQHLQRIRSQRILLLLRQNGKGNQTMLQICKCYRTRIDRCYRPNCQRQIEPNNHIPANHLLKEAR